MIDDLNRLFVEANEDYSAKRYAEASQKYRTILDHISDNPIVWHNYGLSLVSQEKFDEGIEALAFPITHGYAESYLCRGTAYRALGKYEEAMADFARCFIADPSNPNAYSNYGNSLREFGMPKVAIPFFNKALELAPTDPTIRLNESIAHLLSGDLPNGWLNYDARWYYQSDVSFKPNLPGEEYNGTQSIAGKIICVYCEQGFGDSIQFIRYVKLLQELGGNVVLITRPQLVKLFEYNFPDVQIRTSYENLAYHYHVPLLELPKCFNTTIDTIPHPDSYLSMDQKSIDKYSKLLGPKTKKRIGIVWSSNSIAFITRFRQVPLDILLRTLTDDDHELINIEFDVSTEERKLLEIHDVKLVDVDGFDDTAALMKNLDAMVTVDTVYAHLAGALGIPTYVMLADYGMDWRWFLDRTDSPFYNCIKLVRQTNRNDWLSVFNNVKNEIKSTT